MFDIGSSLAAARRARGLELRDAERLTCMRLRYIEALEQERWDDLPGRTYARAFLRTYATALDLDAERLVAEFDEQMPEPEEPVAPPRPRELRLPRVSLVLVAVVALLGIVGWSEWNRGGDVPTAAANRPPTPVVRKRKPRVRVAPRRPARPQPLVIEAVAGECWLLVRRDSATGTVISERTLEPGERVSFAARRVWVRLGAPWNVVVHRGSHRVRIPATGQPADVVA